MGLDIWFKDDIANIIHAMDEANSAALATGSGDAQLRGELTPALREAYGAGFAAALATVAVALGLPCPARPGRAGQGSAGQEQNGAGSATVGLVHLVRR